MNAEDLRELAERATGVEGRPTTRLGEVHSRIRSLRRRRQAGAVAATVVAVVLALTAGSAVVKLTDADPPPVTPPSPSPTPNVDEDKGVPAVRSLVWARGSTIHVGDKTIDVGGEVAGVAATDDGALFTLGEKLPRGCMESVGECGSALWFTDGSDRSTRIGRVFGTVVRGYQIDVSTAGSTVVWFEPADDHRGNNAVYRERGEFVVYDTHAGREVGRFGSSRSRLLAVLDDVYWLRDGDQCVGFYDECVRFTGSAMRLDVATGRRQPVPWATYLTARTGWPRTLVTPMLEEVSDPERVVRPPGAAARYTDTFDFLRDGSRLVGDDGSVPTTVRLARTGQQVRLRLPRDYHADVELLFFQMWLDDDRIALVADNREDILTCRLANGRCRIVVRGPTDYGFGGHG